MDTIICIQVDRKDIGAVMQYAQGLPRLRTCCSQHFSQMKKLEPNEINFSQGCSPKVVSTSFFVFNSLPARGDFCCLLITFAKSLDPDQDPNCLTLDGIEKIQHLKSKIWHNNEE